jgi:hypothetical protein
MLPSVIRRAWWVLGHSMTSSARPMSESGTESPERLCGLEVDDQLDFHRLLNRQVTRFGTFENSPRVGANLPIGISKVGSIAH